MVSDCGISNGVGQKTHSSSDLRRGGVSEWQRYTRVSKTPRTENRTNGRLTSGNEDQLGLAAAEGLQSALVAQDNPAALHNKSQLRVAVRKNSKLACCILVSQSIVNRLWVMTASKRAPVVFPLPGRRIGDTTAVSDGLHGRKSVGTKPGNVHGAGVLLALLGRHCDGWYRQVSGSRVGRWAVSRGGCRRWLDLTCVSCSNDGIIPGNSGRWISKDGAPQYTPIEREHQSKRLVIRRALMTRIG